MKVQCPNCNAGYNIDDKIISDAGIYAICNCENRFLVMKDSGKAAAETRIQEKSKTDIAPKTAQKAPKKVEEAPKKAQKASKKVEEALKKVEEAPKKVEEAPKKTEKALKAADGKQKTGKESDEIRKTLKYTTLAVTLSYALLFGIYHFYFSQNKISLTHKFIEVFESLKLRFMRQS
jgi:Fe2+ transport system protein B